MTKIEKLKKWINESKTLVILTGAGISVPSGIPDFRGEGKKNKAEEILTYKYMISHNKEFNNYIRDYLYHPNALPNIIHKFIYELESKGKLNSLITQNIDDLHKLAGSKNYIPIHGSLNTWHCIECEKKYNIKDLDLNESTICECGGIIRPDIVLYLEPTDETYCHLATVKGQIADMIIVIGSSLSVSTATNI
ncbi:MAG: hypothetical protein K6A63_03175, partial [Acholeplasmatales bacterium]|nr:hypothetical protein [Acholeplasmatales bacterium]